MLGAMLPEDVRPAKPPLPLVDDPGPRRLLRAPLHGPGERPRADLAHAEPEVVQLLTAGFDNALRYVPRGVTLCNAGGVHDASTAELAVGLILASLRGLDEFARAMPSGAWVYARREALADKRVLVIGAGGVGRAIAAATRALRDRRHDGRRARPARASWPPPTSAVLLPTVDVVVLAVPLTEATTGPGRRRFPGAHARRRAARERLARAGGRHRGAGAARGDGPDPGGARRHRPRAAAARPSAVDPARACSSARTWAATRRPSCRVRGPLVAAQMRRFAAGEPLASVVSR